MKFTRLAPGDDDAASVTSGGSRSVFCDALDVNDDDDEVVVANGTPSQGGPLGDHAGGVVALACADNALAAAAAAVFFIRGIRFTPSRLQCNSDYRFVKPFFNCESKKCRVFLYFFTKTSIKSLKKHPH